MAWFDALAGIGDFLSGLFKTGYDVYQDQRDTQYQHELQQTVFDREDNAVQRRMADLQAAGLNPNLAAGSAAGAGSVVGRSAAHNVQEPGSALDMVSALNQLKLQREEVELKKEENEIVKIEKENTRLAALAQRMQLYSQLGFNVYPHLFNGDLSYVVSGKASANGMYTYPEASPLYQIERNLYIQNQLNSAAMLQFDRDFYSRHQIFKNFVQPITGAVLQGGVTAARMYGAFGPK